MGGSDPHYQVFVELKGVRNLTEEQRHKVRGTGYIFFPFFKEILPFSWCHCCVFSSLSAGRLPAAGLGGVQIFPH